MVGAFFINWAVGIVIVFAAMCLSDSFVSGLFAGIVMMAVQHVIYELAE